MEKSKVVIIGGLPSFLLDQVKKACEVKLWDSQEPIPESTLKDWIKDADGLISRGDVPVNEDLLSHGSKLKVVAQCSVGYDNVDIEACTDKSIPFGNTPTVLNHATADLTYALLLNAARRIHEGWDYVKNGQWESSFNIPMGVDLYDKTLGIIGMGNIGREVAKRAQASGMKIIYNNRTENEKNQRLGARHVSFDELLTESDFIVVLVPLSKATTGLIGSEAFKKMKSTAMFINVSRGAVVDTEAMYQALADREIAYAALDVTDPEPIHIDHPLMELDNILITPHIGSATIETRTKMAELTVQNLLAGLNQKPLPACVNDKVNN